MATDSIDPEKGTVSPTVRAATSSWASSAPASVPANPNYSTAHTPLQHFQLLVGLHTPPSLTQEGQHLDKTIDAKRGRGRSDNVGLYQRAKDHERQSRIQFNCTGFISNTLFLVQILLAATFTALSAYKNSHRVTLTVLGAVNTVIAGCLAWQKGQGVPQRYRKAMDQYQALIFEIEMAERSFLDLENNQGEEGVKLDPRAEFARLEKLYDTARADQQANYPDLYVSTGASAAKDLKDLAKQAEDAKAEMAKVQGEMMDRIGSLVTNLEGKVDAHIEAPINDVSKEVGV